LQREKEVRRSKQKKCQREQFFWVLVVLIQVPKKLDMKVAQDTPRTQESKKKKKKGT
jgi:hypothetical protein